MGWWEPTGPLAPTQPGDSRSRWLHEKSATLEEPELGASAFTTPGPRNGAYRPVVAWGRPQQCTWGLHRASLAAQLGKDSERTLTFTSPIKLGLFTCKVNRKTFSDERKQGLPFLMDGLPFLGCPPKSRGAGRDPWPTSGEEMFKTCRQRAHRQG